MTHLLLKLSAAAAILAATPALASAHTVAYGQSPVTVNSCSITPSYEPASFDKPLAFGGPLGFAGPNDAAANSFAVDYVNKGNVPATTVKFTLGGGDRMQNIVAKGTFAPGVAIKQTYALDNGAVASANPNCTVAEVDFADGTTWQAPHEVASR
jgi:hypothetical protein